MRNQGQTVIEYILIVLTIGIVGSLLISRLAKADSLPEPEGEKCVKLCPTPTPKPKPAVKKQVIVKTVVQKEKPEQKQEQEQGQDQKQNVNVYINNGDNGHSHYRERIIKVPQRARFRVGAHAGCGPVGVKSVQVSPTITQYNLRDGLVIGGSLSVRVLGPVWITGQMFTNGLTTGGVEVEF